MNKVYLLTGGNLGNRVNNLGEAVKKLNGWAGTIVQTSALFETAAWGFAEQSSFLNQAIGLNSDHKPHVLLDIILQIEQEMGRVRQEKNGPRIIDIDILFFGNEIIDDARLTVPHPLISERRFALVPLNDIAPQLIHPLLKRSISSLLTTCEDPLPVTRYTNA
jgi:2-amino-4-hydroxy-6-hydroxymethyldihydropteridine diphosphokinase